MYARAAENLKCKENFATRENEETEDKQIKWRLNNYHEERSLRR